MEQPDDLTQAHLAVRKTEIGQTLSMPEREVVAQAIVTGKTSQIKTPQMREALVESLISLGVTSDYLAQKLKDGIEAEETKFFAHEGEVTDTREVVAWGPRHAFLRTAFKLLGVESKAGVRVNAKNFVYRPMLRGGGETIEVRVPTESVLKRRMAAAKHHSRLMPEGADA